MKDDRALNNMSKAHSSMIKNDALGFLLLLDVRLTTTCLKILVNFIYEVSGSIFRLTFQTLSDVSYSDEKSFYIFLKILSLFLAVVKFLGNSSCLAIFDSDHVFPARFPCFVSC